MKVKDLRTNSKQLDLETNVDALIRESSHRLADIREVKGIPAFVEVYEGPAYRTTENVMVKRYRYFGKEVPRRHDVSKRTIGSLVTYFEPRDLEHVPQDFKLIEQASGLNFTDAKTGHLDLSIFTGKWDVSWSESLKREELEPKVIATARYYTLLTKEEREALLNTGVELIEPEYIKGRYHLRDGQGLSTSNYPEMLVRKSWTGPLNEHAIWIFLEEFGRIDRIFGITARSLQELGYNPIRPTSSLHWKIDLSSGQLSPVINFFDDSRFNLRPSVGIYLQNNRHHFHLTY